MSDEREPLLGVEGRSDRSVAHTNLPVHQWLIQYLAITLSAAAITLAIVLPLVLFRGKQTSTYISIPPPCCGVPSGETGPFPRQIKHLVTFGDSYTDAVSLRSTYGAHVTHWTRLSMIFQWQTGDGGVAWPTYAAGYGEFALHPYAKAGASCSNLLTAKPFLSVLEGQLPAYFSDDLNLDMSTAVFTLWIGTNDAGVFLAGQQEPGVTVVNTTDCMIEWVTQLYAHGARNIVVQNVGLGRALGHLKEGRSHHGICRCCLCRKYPCIRQTRIRTDIGPQRGTQLSGISS